MKTIRPDSEMASRIVSVHEAATFFCVDAVTIRRWLVAGCPCVRPGHRGPGRGALVDLEQVAQWRGKSAVSTGLTIDEVMDRIAIALAGSLFHKHADICADVDRTAAAAVLHVAFESCCEEFKKTYSFGQQPKAIQTLLHEL